MLWVNAASHQSQPNISRQERHLRNDQVWWLFQIAIMTLIIGSNGTYHWGGPHSGFAVAPVAPS